MVIATVRYQDKQVGAVVWDERTQVGTFEFSPEFVEARIDLAPLTMPLDELLRDNRIFNFPALPRDTYYGLPGLLADGLPDKFGNAVISAWQSKTGRSALNPVERLCYIGRRAMGALEFEPAAKNIDTSADTIDVAQLVELAGEIMSTREGLQTKINADASADAMMEIIKVGTSAGGARAKAVIAFNENTNEVRSGQLDAPAGFRHWLLKFDGVESGAIGDSKGFGRIELAYHKMALAAGIRMSEAALLEENGRAHFMTRRFDRPDEGGKIHMQTLCGLAHMDFNAQGTHSYEQVFEIMRLLGLPYADAEEMFRRMVFNVWARNLDDHTKNTSFLMDAQGTWRLAPAYDLTYSYNPSGWTHQHQLSVNGKFKNITEDDMKEVARAMNIRQLDHVLEQIRHALDQWQGLASECAVPDPVSAAIKKEMLHN